MTMHGEGWQPIETAPKDGRYILVFHTMPIIARWYTHFRNGKPDPFREPEWDCRCMAADVPPVEPTHWMPLPEPPK